MVRFWFVQRIIFHFSNFVTLLTSQSKTVMALVPLLEGCCINLNNGILHQGFGTDQFVVTCIVHDIKNPGFARDALGSPGVVSGVESHGSVFDVSTSASHSVDT